MALIKSPNKLFILLCLLWINCMVASHSLKIDFDAIEEKVAQIEAEKAMVENDFKDKKDDKEENFKNINNNKTPKKAQSHWIIKSFNNIQQWVEKPLVRLGIIMGSIAIFLIIGHSNKKTNMTENKKLLDEYLNVVVKF